MTRRAASSRTRSPRPRRRSRENFAIECDVQLSRDEEVFVFHDDTLDRLTDATGALIEKSAAEIRRARIAAA